MPSSQQLLETWDIHNRANLMLLDALDDAALDAVSRPRARDVGAQFAHLHNVRLMWLEVAAPDLATSLSKIEKGAEQRGKARLQEALQASGDAIRTLLGWSFDAGKVKGFKPHPAAFLGYLISHESHHRGQILLTLNLAGIKIAREVQFGIWEWSML